MDTQSFIQSGLLEAYVLNQCTPEERVEVERMAAAHPEVRAELDAIEHALEQVALAYSVLPPSGLKEEILRRIRAEKTPAPPQSGKGGLPWMPVLLWVALAVSVGTVLWQRSENNAAAERVVALENQLADCDTKTQQQDKLQAVVALLRDRDTRTIVLSDAAPGADAKVTGTVWHNPARAETLLDINSLPAPDPGKHFQFWAIVDGQPVSMGMVNFRGADAWQILPFISNAQAFAISAEDNPNGNPTPTIVVLVGKV